MAKQKTKYVVLRAQSAYTWAVVGETEASSAKSAIRQIVSGMLTEAAENEVPNETLDRTEFVAVPVSSWQPQPVNVYMQQRLAIG